MFFYLRNVLSKPIKPPNIHWSYYKQHLKSDQIKWLEEFKCKYENFKIPVPKDDYLEKLANQKKDWSKDVQKYIDNSNQRIKLHQCKLDQLKKITPFEQMTWQEYMEIYPDEAPNFKESLWPHTPDEQPGYIEPSTFRK